MTSIFKVGDRVQNKVCGWSGTVYSVAGSGYVTVDRDDGKCGEGVYMPQRGYSGWYTDVSELTLISSSNLNSKGVIMSVIKDLLKSKKQKLYEEYVLNSEGNIDFTRPAVQKFMFDFMEETGLEKFLKDWEKKEKEEKKAQK